MNLETVQQRRWRKTTHAHALYAFESDHQSQENGFRQYARTLISILDVSKQRDEKLTHDLLMHTDVTITTQHKISNISVRWQKKCLIMYE